MQKDRPLYILAFAAAVCVVCSLLVSTAAVMLRERQQENALLDRQKNVLSAIGLLPPGARPSRAKVAELFERVIPRVVHLASGEYATEIDPLTFNQDRAARDPELSRPAPPNQSRIMRLPLYGLVYEVQESDRIETVVLPIQGMGLWATMYGFIALGQDGSTIEGLTYYQHSETPGLGGEVDNPRWKSLWPGRQAFDEQGEVRIGLKRGAGSPAEDPYHVDALSGATITGRGIEAMLDFWLGEHGFGPYLERLRTAREDL